LYIVSGESCGAFVENRCLSASTRTGLCDAAEIRQAAEWLGLRADYSGYEASHRALYCR
jgi:hypothetical protein